MKILPYNNPGNIELYNPSDDELIISPFLEEADLDAEALIADWLSENLTEPVIKDRRLIVAWEKYRKGTFRDAKDKIQSLDSFLEGFVNDSWVVYREFTQPEIPGFPPFIRWLVVKSDTLIREAEADESEQV
jgi:hypothetical protein